MAKRNVPIIPNDDPSRERSKPTWVPRNEADSRRISETRRDRDRIEDYHPFPQTR